MPSMRSSTGPHSVGLDVGIRPDDLAPARAHAPFRHNLLMSAYLYVLGDADRVREGIDQRLLRGRLDELRAFSAALTEGIAALLRSFEVEMGAEVIMAGGDDVLLVVDASRYSVEKNRAVAAHFLKATGCAISFGVSASLQGAYINLRRAKAEHSGVCFEDSQT